MKIIKHYIKKPGVGYVLIDQEEFNRLSESGEILNLSHYQTETEKDDTPAWEKELLYANANSHSRAKDAFKPFYSRELGGMITSPSMHKQRCKEKGYVCFGTDTKPYDGPSGKKPMLKQEEIKKIIDKSGIGPEGGQLLEKL